MFDWDTFTQQTLAEAALAIADENGNLHCEETGRFVAPEEEYFGTCPPEGEAGWTAAGVMRWTRPKPPEPITLEDAETAMDLAAEMVADMVAAKLAKRD